MKILFDYFPIICFFIAYKLYGIYVATVVTMIACGIQIGTYWIMHRRFEKMNVITLFVVVLLGGSTLIFHNAIFIQWKPSVVYWLFSIVMLGSHVIGKKTIMQRMLDAKVTMPRSIWSRINFAWGVFFMLLGFLNLYVAYHYSLNAWVNFKLFGTLGILLVFVILQALYMSRYIESAEKE